MKQSQLYILTLLLIVSFFSTKGDAQNYVHDRTLTGHMGSVWSVAFSPNGEILASGCWDKTIRLWTVNTGKHLHTLTGHTHWVYSVAFSPEGQKLASASADNSIRLWNVDTGRHLHTLTGHTGGVCSTAFASDGKTLASGSSDDTIRLWSVETRRHLHTLSVETGTTSNDAILNVAFSPDEQTFATASFDNNVRLWSIKTGNLLHTLKGMNWVDSVEFSPNGKIITSGGGNETLRLWSVETSQPLSTLKGHIGSIDSVAFSPNGEIVATGSTDNTVRLWSVTTGRHLQTLTGHTGGVTSIAFSVDGTTLASSDRDRNIRLWKVSGSPKLTSRANQIYEKTIRTVMWLVNPGVGTGSGVLFDKELRLALTNAHVIDTQTTIDIYFPASNEKGKLITDKNFYLDNLNVLKQLGYYTKGRVITKNEETDLAIIQLDGLPETAREINIRATTVPKAGDLVYILGNPGGQDLWRWTIGKLLKEYKDFIHIQSDVIAGNSGGPVLTEQGHFIGIVTRSDEFMNAIAIPTRLIRQLLSAPKVQRVR